jgi:hypothetical protein
VAVLVLLVIARSLQQGAATAGQTWITSSKPLKLIMRGGIGGVSHVLPSALFSTSSNLKDSSARPMCRGTLDILPHVTILALQSYKITKYYTEFVWERKKSRHNLLIPMLTFRNSPASKLPTRSFSVQYTRAPRRRRSNPSLIGAQPYLDRN